ncbi:peptidase C26-domain-containing protein [Pelagophyceae sp. CCMP2097]|nr:peptidase C26-domain-containing protein [Pelagophyceae sp. CCMP2097]
MVFYGLILALALSRSAAAPGPVIGVITQPGTAEYAQYIAASYVKFVEAGGGRVVPVSFLASNETADLMFSRLNGVLFTGGDSGLPDVARRAVEYSVQAFARGESFPIWGTCLGFEWLAEIFGGSEVLARGNDTYAENISLPLEWTAAASTSRIFGGAENEQLRALLSQERLAMNNHQFAVTPETFAEKLAGDFTLISTSRTFEGAAFSSTMEHRILPIFGVQFHPEKNAFEMGIRNDGTSYETTSHTPDAVRLTQHVAKFFVDEARSSNQRLDAADLQRNLVYNCRTSTALDPEFVQSYFFPRAWDSTTPPC